MQCFDIDNEERKLITLGEGFSSRIERREEVEKVSKSHCNYQEGQINKKKTILFKVTQIVRL